MRTPILVRSLTDKERQVVECGLRSPDAFVLRRCQILLASARGERAPQIAEHLSCDDQTVLDALHAFNAQGLAALGQGSSRPHTTHPSFSADQAECLRALVARCPRELGKPTSLWTLKLLADVSCEQGLTPSRVTGETIRVTLQRLGLKWQRGKGWITSPDPGYQRKKRPATV
jgi:transposase